MRASSSFCLRVDASALLCFPKFVPWAHCASSKLHLARRRRQLWGPRPPQGEWTGGGMSLERSLLWLTNGRLASGKGDGGHKCLHAGPVTIQHEDSERSRLSLPPPQAHTSLSPTQGSSCTSRNKTLKPFKSWETHVYLPTSEVLCAISLVPWARASSNLPDAERRGSESSEFWRAGGGRHFPSCPELRKRLTGADVGSKGQKGSQCIHSVLRVWPPQTPSGTPVITQRSSRHRATETQVLVFQGMNFKVLLSLPWGQRSQKGQKLILS